MSVEGLAQARRDRDAKAAATAARKARLERRVAIIRGAILYPAVIAVLALLWWIGVLYGRLICRF